MNLTTRDPLYACLVYVKSIEARLSSITIKKIVLFQLMIDAKLANGVLVIIFYNNLQLVLSHLQVGSSSAAKTPRN